MRQLHWIAALAHCCCLVVASPAAAAFPEEPPPLRKPLEPMVGSVGVTYWGTVTEVNKTSITIQFDNQKSQKPKRFLVSKTLAAGKIPMEARPTPLSRQPYSVLPGAMYRLSDVKVGDWVQIKYARLEGGDICDHISIRKRPGGRVPPLSEQADPLSTPLGGRPRIRYHEYMNAYWDLEEKGIPYPEKFGEFRRFPIAPMPRAVGPDISR